jgi:hypothetical protein
MWSGREVFENNSCSISDELLGTIYRASDSQSLAIAIVAANATRISWVDRRAKVHRAGAVSDRAALTSARAAVELLDEILAVRLTIMDEPGSRR